MALKVSEFSVLTKEDTGYESQIPFVDKDAVAPCVSYPVLILLAAYLWVRGMRAGSSWYFNDIYHSELFPQN